MSEQNNNKTIAKNAFFLYVRMLLSLVVSLYTSRVVLQVLGISDYGIYSIVGGVVVLFNFLNASMSGATSRFLTFEIGKGNKENINRVFGNALAVHLIITVVVAVLLETVGLWLLSNKLVIAPDRMFAAHVVYQLSVLSTLVGITQVPYNASIIAHEKMDIYAYVELANVTLKLLIVYLLCIGNYDKLILYGVLMLMVSVLIMLAYRYYGWTHFEECRQRPSIDKATFKPMFAYAAWGLYGDGCYSLRQQGTNILLNMFFGTVVNAANGLASTVLSVVSSFVQTVLTAFRPQIIKSYAVGDIRRMEQLMTYATRYSFLLMGLMTIILSCEMDFILGLWLKEVPPYTPWICRIILISFCVVTCSFVASAGIQASGAVKYHSFLMGTISLFGVLPCTYLLLKLGYSPYSAYVCYGIFTIVMYVCALFILKKQIPGVHLSLILVKGMAPIVCVLVLATITCLALVLWVPDGFLRVVYVSVVSILLTIVLMYLFVMNQEEKAMAARLLTKLKNKFVK